MSLLRFHWDFFGPDAQPTAEHFLRHLDTFCTREGIDSYRHWVSRSAVGSTASLECEDVYLKLVRDALRPKRGEKVLE
jgi:hypothetical protein